MPEGTWTFSWTCSKGGTEEDEGQTWLISWETIWWPHCTRSKESTALVISRGRVISHCWWKSTLQSQKPRQPVQERKLKTPQQKWALSRPAQSGRDSCSALLRRAQFSFSVWTSGHPPAFHTPGNLPPLGLTQLFQLCPNASPKRSQKSRVLGYVESRRNKEMLFVTF